MFQTESSEDKDKIKIKVFRVKQEQNTFYNRKLGPGVRVLIPCNYEKISLFVVLTAHLCLGTHCLCKQHCLDPRIAQTPLRIL